MDTLVVFSNEPLTIGTLVIRIAIAVFLGGLIGLERGASSHPAGFRTHILVCVGACLAMMTNQFVFEAVGVPGSDPTRMGAQVISGIGFLGVGTIFLLGRNVKGLTTAAGLWASGAIGLATGIGFYAGAIIAAVIVLVVLGIFPLFENSLYRAGRLMRLHVEFDSLESERAFVKSFEEGGSMIKSKTILTISNAEKRVITSYTIRLKYGVEREKLIEELSGNQGVLVIDIQY